ncbi:conjugal transfer protein TraG [Massilia sp. Root351]|uniref:conjugal transfer protein TraG N-terminal domain-containing protein n=1 Tax=Massilia sp. Root351 TaxID=1736522 RepID=UPI00070F4B1A|nr:conjugal transfer protein TraG N-terminal domain-containing protein [Massilia sp. Root351]KQV81004.1 conjugal transfer protein TraG [Massilia sp. Root351]
MWEVYAYQNSDSLFGVLNAIAAICGSGSYASALGVVAFCGFFAALAAYAFAPQKLQGWYWLASITLVLSVLLVPKVTVGIVDKTGGSAVTVVDNVPFGLAVFGSLSSRVGNTLTELYETAMQVLPGAAGLPSELAYQRNGLMFGNRMIRETSRIVFQNPSFRTDLINFINNCTIYDLASGNLSPEVFATSGDIWPLMATPNPARFTPISDGVGGMTVAPCTDAYTNLNNRLPVQLDRVKAVLSTRMNPTLSGPAAAAVIAGQIQQAYIKNGIADAASTAADIIRQNALINAVNDASLLAGQKINDPASMLLAVGRAQAVAQTNAAWINNGKVAEQALPVIRNTVEALAYAIFTIVILLLMLTSGRETAVALKNYVSLLIWIQLWPPLYAILNYMAMVYAAKDLAAAASVGGGASSLSLLTAPSIYSNAVSGEAVVGYMTMSIPLIAWVALKRMETLGSALVAGAHSLQSMLTSTSSAAATGNVSMGNTSMDQVSLAPARSSAFFRSQQNDFTGNTYTSNMLSGLTAAKALANEGPVSRVVDTKISQQHVEASSKSVAAARTESLSASKEKAAALSDALVNAAAQSTSHTRTDGTSTSSSESIGEKIGELMQIARSVAATTGASEQQVASVAFGGSSYIGVGLPGALRQLSPVDVHAQIQGRGGKEYSAAIQKQDQRIDNSLSSEDKAKFKAFADTVSKNTGSISAVLSDHRSGKEIAARLTETVSHSERADANLRRQLDFSASLVSALQRGESISKDLAKDPSNIALFEQLLRSEHNGSAAELVKMEAFLGGITRVPMPVSKASRLPSSFDEVRDDYLNAKRENEGSQSVDKSIDSYQSRVRGRSDAESATHAGKTPTKMSSPLRQEIAQKESELTQRMRQQQNQLESERVTRTDRNHVTTDRSLLEKANEQVKDDPDIVAKKLKEMMDKIERNWK